MCCNTVCGPCCGVELCGGVVRLVPSFWVVGGVLFCFGVFWLCMFGGWWGVCRVAIWLCRSVFLLCGLGFRHLVMLILLFWCCVFMCAYGMVVCRCCWLLYGLLGFCEGEYCFVWGADVVVGSLFLSAGFGVLLVG